jgi:tetratricopeptide (TPR) repeat protein
MFRKHPLVAPTSSLSRSAESSRKVKADAPGCDCAIANWQAIAKRKADALAEKEQGNAAYKKKDFQNAVDHYDRALELYDGDISFLTNR